MPDPVKEILSENRVRDVVTGIQSVIQYLKLSAYSDPARTFEPLTCNSTGKKMLFIDKAAEKMLVSILNKIFSDCYEVAIYGEESLELSPPIKKGDIGRFSPKSTEKVKLVFLLDAVDGTDLYVKNLGNWCTAVLVYTDKEKKILGSFVGLPSGTVYFSTDDIHGVAKKPIEGDITAVPTINTRLNCKDITLAWYGQKANKFLSLARHKKFLAFIQSQRTDSNFRILNIGGIPLMIRLIDGLVPINVMVELYGQQPHDMIAGAYLVKKAGAILTDLKGNTLDFTRYLDDLKVERLKYILATSKKCHKIALNIFRSSNRGCKHSRQTP